MISDAREGVYANVLSGLAGSVLPEGTLSAQGKHNSGLRVAYCTSHKQIPLLFAILTDPPLPVVLPEAWAGA